MSTVISLVSIAIALAALAVSALNFWLTQLRRGQVRLSQPTIFFFGWDKHDEEDVPKIMFRSALFSTGNRGHFVENLYIVVKNGAGDFTFPYWGYDDGKGMVKGSGLFIGTTGHIAYHHFNPVHVQDDFFYEAGKYQVEVWAQIFGFHRATMLGKYELSLDEGQFAVKLSHHESGVMWNWSPSDRIYYAELRDRRYRELPRLDH